MQYMCKAMDHPRVATRHTTDKIYIDSVKVYI